MELPTTTPTYIASVAVASAPYDYSQPVVVNNYVSAEATPDNSVAEAEPFGRLSRLVRRR